LPVLQDSDSGTSEVSVIALMPLGLYVYFSSFLIVITPPFLLVLTCKAYFLREGIAFQMRIPGISC